jgi:hypothetical protein
MFLYLKHMFQGLGFENGLAYILLLINWWLTIKLNNINDIIYMGLTLCTMA